jgi:hypothetical protein
MSDEVALECPNCKKPGLIRLRSDDDIFECVYCHYKDNLREGTDSRSNLWLAIFIVAAVAIFFLTG